jgi:hypothetical protein
MKCASAGADLSCTLERKETGYCANPTPLDVTVRAQWISSNEAAAVFLLPGRLHVVAPGHVEIEAKSLADPYLSAPHQAYVVSPASPPDRLVEFEVGVRDAVTGAWLDGANVELVPDRGAPQSGRVVGFSTASFWIYITTVRVRVTRDGYLPNETLVTVPTPQYCYCFGVSVLLTRASAS